MFSSAHWLSSLVNRISVVSAKQAELTPGQVFKGTVLKLYPDQMALVQIGGMQVHARLEANLEVGQKAWLQVQPGANPVTLKVLTTPENPQEAEDASLEGLLRSLRLPDNKEGRAIVQALVRQGLPLSKETVQAFVALAAEVGHTDDVVQAFLYAFKRNLPLTREVVAALATFWSQTTLTDVMQAFLKEADAFLRLAKPDQLPLAQMVRAVRDQLGAVPLLIGETAAQPATPSSQPGGVSAQPSAGSAAPNARFGSVPASVSLAGELAFPSDSDHDAQGMPAPARLNPADRLGRADFPSSSQIVRSSIQSGSVQRETASLDVTQANQTVPADRGNPQPQQAGGSVLGQPAFPSRPGAEAVPLPTSQQPQADGGRVAVQGSASFLPESSADGAPGEVSAARQGSGIETGQESTARQQRGTVPAMEGTPNSRFSPAPPLEQLNQQSGAIPSVRTTSGMEGETTGSASPAQGTRSLSPEASPASPVHHSIAPTDKEHTSLPVFSVAAGTGEGEKGSLIRDWFHRLGLMHERVIGKMAIEPTVSAFPTDSVKSLLLQLQSHSASLPAGLREAADALLQHVTGQQLMLSQTQTQGVSHLVIQLPVWTDQGEETAFIQIEAKKREGGQLDPENCRLFFHLDLHHLGTTMLDVNIVNRIINVSLFNDSPWLQDVAAGMKREFADQLREAGYQLSGLRVQPIPKEKAGTPATKQAPHLPGEYKGVDIRI